MAQSYDRTQQWRQAFQSEREAFEHGAQCPDQDTIWHAATNQLPARERRQVVLHLADCGACAESWRVAAALDAALGTLDDVPRQTLWQRWQRWFTPLPAWAAAGAGAAIVLLALMWWQSAPPPLPPAQPGNFMRGAEQQAVLHSTMAADTLALSAPRLQWQLQRAEAQSYRLRVFVNDVELLFEAAGLTRPEYRLEADEIDSLEVGQQLLWQVSAQLSDGTEVRSPVYTLTVVP